MQERMPLSAFQYLLVSLEPNFSTHAWLSERRQCQRNEHTQAEHPIICKHEKSWSHIRITSYMLLLPAAHQNTLTDTLMPSYLDSLIPWLLDALMGDHTYLFILERTSVCWCHVFFRGHAKYEHQPIFRQATYAHDLTVVQVLLFPENTQILHRLAVLPCACKTKFFFGHWEPCQFAAQVWVHGTCLISERTWHLFSSWHVRSFIWCCGFSAH